MPANVETMMYTGSKPWHGLGVAVEGAQHAASAIKAAGLDWNVEKRDLYAAGAAGQTAQLVGDYKAIVRVSDEKALGIVGKRYQPFQNVEAFDFFDGVVGEHAAMYETAGSLDDGRRIFLLAKLPSSIKVTRDDVVDKYLLLSNTHDGSGAIRMHYTPIRVVCQNTLNAAMRGFNTKDGVSIRHTKNARQKIDEAKSVLGLANRYYDVLGETFKALAQTKYTVKQSIALVNHLFPSSEEEIATRTKNNREAALNLMENGVGQKKIEGTAWAAYNGITEYSDHHRSTRVSEGGNEAESRLTANWFGSGRVLKQKAWDFIAEQTGLKLQAAA